MAKTFHLTLARVGENLFDGEVLSATIPGKEGVFQVLPEHEAFVSELAQGAMHIKTAEGETRDFDIPQGGIAEISRNQATILL